MGNLSMLTGNIGRPGVGVNPLRGQNNVQGACDMGAYPNVFSGYQAVAVPENRAKMEKLWFLKEGSLPDWYGVTLTEQINQAGDPIKAMYFMGLNPVVSYPDSNHVMRQLDKLDFLVVQDIFWNESCEYADVVLPGTCFAEKDGTFTSGERRVNRVRKAVDGPGESKYDWEIIGMLAKKMGLKGFDWKTGKGRLGRHAGMHPGPVRGNLREDGEARVSPLALPDHRAPREPRSSTGRSSPQRMAWGPSLALSTARRQKWRTRNTRITLMTGRVIFHYHTRTQTDRCKVLHYEVPESFIQMNTQDAAELGIKNLEKIKVRSRRGEIDHHCTGER